MNPIAVVAPGVVEYKRPTGASGEIIFRAENIRSEKTGIHARLLIYFNTTMLVGSVFNIERDEERNRFINAAHKMLGRERDAIIDKADMKHELDLFVFAVWPALLETKDAEMLVGDSMSPLEFIAKPHILQGGGTILFGEQGRGKSYTAILCAICVQYGLNGLWATKQTSTLLVNLERSSESVQRRIGHINNALGLSPDSPLLTINARGRSLMDVQPSIERAVRKHKVGFIVVDSISRMGIGDLTLNHTVSEAMDLLNSLAPSWLGLGHSPRADKSHLFGSVMFDTAADIMVRLTSEKKEPDMGILLEVTKANDIKFPEPMTLVYGFDEFGLKTIRRAKAGEYANLVADTRSLPQKIYDYLLDEKGRASATEIAETLKADRSGVSRILNADERFTSFQGQGREVFYAVKAVV